MRTDNLPEIEQYRLANRDPDVMTVIRGVLKGARSFISDGLRTTLVHDEDSGVIHITVQTDHTRELCMCLAARFSLNAERDGDVITVPTGQLETGADR